MKALVNTKEFKRVVKALKPFTKDYDKMKYIRLEVDSKNREIKAEALDGHRIAIEYLSCQAEESFVAYIKPFPFWKTDTEYSEIELIGEEAIVGMGCYFLKFKQPEGEWYKSNEMISKLDAEKPSFKIGVDADFLIDALKNVKERTYGKNLVTIEFRGKKDPIIVKDYQETRNIRLVLPVNIHDDEQEAKG